MKPKLTIIPAGPLTGEDQTMDLLVRIEAPEVQGAPPPLSLVIALDTSGSMNGLPLELARQAARQVFQQRGEAHLGLVTFGTRAQVIAPLQRWESERGFLNALDTLSTTGSTALHAGWRLAMALLLAEQEQQAAYRLPRVLLLTDGHANVGPRRPEELAAAVRSGVANGVSTSAVGLGDHYDELVLETLASEGDGTYHYAEEPQHLEGLFLKELESLKKNFGRLVSLGIEGVEVLDILNDLPRLPNGRTALPPLQVGGSLDLLVRVQTKAGDTLRLRLAWTDANGERCVQRAEEVLTDGDVLSGQSQEVSQLRTQLELAREQRRIASLVDAGDHLQASARLRMAGEHLRRVIPEGLELQAELRTLEQLQQRQQRGERRAFSKQARSEAYQYSSGRKKGGR